MGIIVFLAQDDISAWERILERWGLSILLLGLAIGGLVYLYKHTVAKDVYVKLCEDLGNKVDIVCSTLIELSTALELQGEYHSLITQALANSTRSIEQMNLELHKHHEMMMEYRRLNGKGSG